MMIIVQLYCLKVSVFFCTESYIALFWLGPATPTRLDDFLRAATLAKYQVVIKRKAYFVRTL